MCINLQARVSIDVKLLIWKVSSQIHSILITQSLAAFQDGLVFLSQGVSQCGSLSYFCFNGWNAQLLSKSLAYMAHFQSTKRGWPSKTTGPTGFPRFKPLSIQIKQSWWNIFPYWQSSTDYVYILFPSCSQTVSFFTGVIYRSPLLRQFAAIVLINPVSGYTCIIHNMYICTFRFGQRFSPIGKRKCLVIRQFFLAEITFGRKKNLSSWK